MQAENHGDDLLNQPDKEVGFSQEQPPEPSRASDDTQLSALRAEVAKWQERVPKLSRALRERTDEVAALRDEVRQLQLRQAGQGEASGGDLDRRLSSRDAHIKELEAKLAELSQQHRAAAGELHTSKLAYQEAEEAAQRWKSKWQAANADLDEALNQQAEQKRSIDGRTAQWEAERQALLDQQQKSRDKDRRDVESLTKRNAQLVETTELANKQIATLGEELQQLVTQLEESRSETVGLRTAMDEADANRAEGQHRVAELEARNSELTQELEQARGVSAEAERSLAEMRQQVQPLSAEVERLEKELVELETLRTHLTETNVQLEARLEQRDARVDELSAAHVVLKAEFENARETHAVAAQESRALHHERDELREQNERMQQELDVARAELQPLRDALEHAQREAGELERVRADLTQTEQALRQRLSDEEARYNKLEGDRNASIEQLEEAQRHAQAHQSELDALQVEIERLNACVENAQHAQSRRDSEWRATQDQMNGLQEEISGFGDRMQSRDQEIQRLKSNLDERSQLVVELERQLQEANSSGVDVASLQADHQRELDALQNKLATFQDHAASLEGKLTDQRNLMEDLEEELTVAQQETAASAKQVANAEREKNRLQQQLSQVDPSWQKKLADAERDNSDLRVRNQQLDADRKAFEEAVDDLTRELQAAEAKAHEAKVEITALRAEAVSDEEVNAQRGRVRELEQLLRERTKELDELKWRLQQEQNQADENVVMVLNQQLKDARAELERLKADANDDLTRLKGVGDKLAQQLASLGYSKLEQIAYLDAQELERENHPLFNLKARIVRDEWIAQARELTGLS